jgi:hypothetical protein
MKIGDGRAVEIGANQGGPMAADRDGKSLAVLRSSRPFCQLHRAARRLEPGGFSSRRLRLLGDGFVWVFRRNVGDVDYLLRADDSIQTGSISAPDRWRLFIKCRKFLRRVVECNATERLPVTKQHRAERSLTNAGCVCQHSLKNPIELSGR